jgi:hypothetical protein
MVTCIRILLIVLLLCSPAAAQLGEPTLEERQQRIEILMKELEVQMATPNTEHHVKVKEHWKFRCIVGNATSYPVWLQIWDGQETIFSEVIPAREDKVLWLGDDRARIFYMFQWKKVGASNLDWEYKGWMLDSKAAFILDKTLIPWLLEEEPGPSLGPSWD